MRHDNSPLRQLRITIRSPRAVLGAVTVVTAVTTLSFSVSSTFGSDASEVSDVSYVEESVPGAAGEIGTSITIEEVDPGAVPAPTTPVPVPTATPAPSTTPRAPVTSADEDDEDDEDVVDEDTDEDAGTGDDEEETGDEEASDGESSPAAGGSTAAPSDPSSYRPPTAPAPAGGTAAGTAAGPGVAGDWLSGGTVVDGSFDSWRGTPVESASHWADSQEACENQWGLEDQFADWSGPLVVAIGGLWDAPWSEAANGGFDDVWTTCLNALKSNWGSKPAANLTISLFHEANGTWYDWSVTDGDVGDFKTAFGRFRDLQQQIFPGSRLAFVLNADHVQDGYEPADMLPAPGDYDVLGVDMYSMHSHVDFDQFPALALSAGKPLIVQEWGIKEDEGGGADFLQYMHDKFVQHGGTGAGKLEMENYFDLKEYTISEGTSSPAGAALYRDLF